MRTSRKLAVISFLCGLTCVYGGLFIAEGPEEDNFAVGVNSGSPDTISRVPIHSRMPASVAGNHFVILGITDRIALAQVGLSTIERVAVDVVNQFSVLGFDNYAVHSYRDPLALPNDHTGSVIIVSGDASGRVPIPSHEKVVFPCVHDSDLALCEGNETDRLIERLNNRFAGYAILGHDLTSNEIATFGRICILA